MIDFRLLTGGGASPLPRHQTLLTTIGWSHELCDPLERLLWARLSVFGGSFTLEAAEEICSDENLSADWLFNTLSGLLGKSIVERDWTPSGTRFGMLDTLREYGQTWLERLGDHEIRRLKTRHRDYYARLAEDGERDWFSARQAEVFERTHAEHGNLRSALEFCVGTQGECQAGLRLAGTLWFYWVGCGYVAEGRRWLDRMLATDFEPTPARAKALWVNGYIADLQGDYGSAVTMLQACKTQAAATNDEIAMAYAIHRIGCAALLQDDLTRADEMFTDALARYQSLGELNSNVLMGKVELAITNIFSGDRGRAVELCEEVQDCCEQHGERWAYAWAQFVLAHNKHLEGDLEQAIHLVRESLNSSYQFHDLLSIVLDMEFLALLAAERSHYERAAILQGGAARIWRSVGPQLFGSAYFNAPHVACETAARRALGDQAYESAFQHGTDLTLDEAVAHALAEPNGSGDHNRVR